MINETTARDDDHTAERPDIAVIVVAGGSGARLGEARPKAFVRVGVRTILEHALQSVFAMAEPAHVIVVAPDAEVEEARELALRVAGAARSYLSVVVGGETRQLSVAAGLAALDGERVVLVHDAARSFTPAHRFDAVVDAVRRTGAGVIPVLPVSDTIKRADVAGVVTATLDRTELVIAQTPQGFPAGELGAAYSAALVDHTDDAALFAAAGGAVSTVPGDPLSFKITTPWDLRRAEGLVAGAVDRADAADVAARSIRTGVGIDVHVFDDTQALWLGGLHWPGEVGLAGHSDGDAVAHAICDALLSAARLGDIGGNFGSSDPRFAGAHGEVFLRATAALLEGAGFSILNIAVQVVANHPQLARRRLEMEERLADFVGVPVSVAATTTDGLGFTGRGDGLTAMATALVLRNGRAAQSLS